MGGTSSRAPDAARSPLLNNHPNNAACCSTGFRSTDEDGAQVCSICISSLDRASTFVLPDCGHTFHALCVASALHVSQCCPICRVEVGEQVCQKLATQLITDPAHEKGSKLAAELLMDLKNKGKTCETEYSAEETAEAVRNAAKRGDASKIPPIAALLGRGGKDKASSSSSSSRTPQPRVVRLAAVEALRALVPIFSSSKWPGLSSVLELLRGVVAYDTDEEVRSAALQALKEVGRRGEQTTLVTAKRVLEDSKASAEMRLQAAEVVQALAVKGEPYSVRTALVALGDDDCSVRSVGFSTLKSICSRGECAEFLEDLAAMITKHQEDEVRASALEIVSQVEQVGGPYGIAIATQALRDKGEAVRQAALVCLRRLWAPRDQQAISTLSAIILPGSSQSPDAQLRYCALDALAHIAERGDSAAISAAAGALEDKDSSVQTAAVSALKQLCSRGDAASLALLLRVVRHRDTEVRRLAIEVLGCAATARDADAMRVLQDLQVSGDVDMQLAAEQALRQIR